VSGPFDHWFTEKTVPWIVLGLICIGIWTGSAHKDNKPAFHEETNTYTFGDYDCKDDCSGHQAGYDWAEEHDIDDPDDCGGNSESFIEGCRAYAEEQNGNREE